MDEKCQTIGPVDMLNCCVPVHYNCGLLWRNHATVLQILIYLLLHVKFSAEVCNKDFSDDLCQSILEGASKLDGSNFLWCIWKYIICSLQCSLFQVAFGGLEFFGQAYPVLGVSYSVFFKHLDIDEEASLIMNEILNTASCI